MPAPLDSEKRDDLGRTPLLPISHSPGLPLSPSAPTTITVVTSSPKRSWRRFTLRALFLAVFVAATFFGWVAYRVRQFHDQDRFIADLRARGFRIRTEAVACEWFWRPFVG